MFRERVRESEKAKDRERARFGRLAEDFTEERRRESLQNSRTQRTDRLGKRRSANDSLQGTSSARSSKRRIAPPPALCHSRSFKRALRAPIFTRRTPPPLPLPPRAGVAAPDSLGAVRLVLGELRAACAAFLTAHCTFVPHATRVHASADETEQTMGPEVAAEGKREAGAGEEGGAEGGEEAGDRAQEAALGLRRDGDWLLPYEAVTPECLAQFVDTVHPPLRALLGTRLCELPLVAATGVVPSVVTLLDHPAVDDPQIKADLAWMIATLASGDPSVSRHVFPAIPVLLNNLPTAAGTGAGAGGDIAAGTAAGGGGSGAAQTVLLPLQLQCMAALGNLAWEANARPQLMHQGVATKALFVAVEAAARARGVRGRRVGASPDAALLKLALWTVSHFLQGRRRAACLWVQSAVNAPGNMLICFIVSIPPDPSVWLPSPPHFTPIHRLGRPAW